MRSFLVLLWVILGLALNACESSCDNSDSTPRRYQDGITNGRHTEYQTSTWAGPFLEFGTGRVYELWHGLKGQPTQIKTYLAFRQTPLPGNVAESAGNQVIIEEVTADFIRVRNDTCQEFYLRLVASLPDDGG